MVQKLCRKTIDAINNRSEKSSQLLAPECTNVNWTFDNVQFLMRHWRVMATKKQNMLAAIATSVAQTFPDGLGQSMIQYEVSNSPMNWLNNFSLSTQNKYLVNILDQSILKEMMGVPWSDLEIVLGYWDQKIMKEIKVVKEELGKDMKDVFEKTVEDDLKDGQKICKNGHINQNVRSNRRYCVTCRAEFVDESAENNEKSIDEEEEIPHKCLIIDDSDANNTKVKIEEMKPSQKADLYPNVRNHYSKDAPVIESNGAVLVNPNTFGRLKAVFDYIIDKSGMTGSYSHSIEIGEDGKVRVLPQKQSNIRSAITVTCDGLPHLLAISVIENCFICKKCGIKIESLSSVTAHKNNFNHNTFYKQYGDIILRIGNFHLELTMHRAFVSLNWPIIYSEIAKFVNFKSPKAQLVIQKVANLHKSIVIFMAQRTAKIREILVPFIKHYHKEGIHPSAHYFEEFIDKEVKDPNYKLAVKIELIYGTCLWIMHAAICANRGCSIIS